MSLLAETRRRARFILGPVLGACLVAYFVFHAIQGDRGLLAWAKIEQKIAAARATQAETAAARSDLERRVALLRKDNLDSDMLEERARVMLNLVGEREIVIFDDTAGARRSTRPVGVAEVAKSHIGSSD